MSLVSGLAIYLIIWWTVLFAVLPWGVRTTAESGTELVPGQADSAPAAPMLKKKLLWTTLISFGFFALYWANEHFGWLTLANMPGPFREYVLPPVQ